MASRRGRPAPAPRKKPNEAFLANLTGGPALKKAEASDQVLSGQRIEKAEEAPAQPERQLSVAPSIPTPVEPEAGAGTSNGSVTPVASSEETTKDGAAPEEKEPAGLADSGGVATASPAPVMPAQEQVAEPSPAPSPAVEQDEQPVAEQTEPASVDAEQGSEAEKPARQRKVKVTIMMVESEIERMRSAFVHLPYEARAGSLSQWASRALMEQVRAAEDEYNGGQPWPPIQKGHVPQGRPVGS